MTKAAGLLEAIFQATKRLEAIDLQSRCTLIGLPSPENRSLHLRAFNQNILLKMTDLSLVIEDSEQSVKPADQILILRYLLCEQPVIPTGQLISFRDFPGGRFYWEPFRCRTVIPLIHRIGNNLPRLQRNLDLFEWEPIQFGDLGARIHLLGNLYLYLIYFQGDDEFPANVEILFDACFKQVYGAEEAVTAVSRICSRLME